MTEKTPLLQIIYVDKDLFKLELPDSQYSPELASLVSKTKEALKNNSSPLLISVGSSGSYRMLDKDGRIIGIFKPKDEEPYGKLNPKWQKWMQRVCCPCFFGRSCIIPNIGYISEAGAYIVDKFFDLGIVPPTCIAAFSHTSFNYSKLVKSHIAGKLLVNENKTHVNINELYPPKIGSLQSYVYQYECPSPYVQYLNPENYLLPTVKRFKYEFDKLVVLDYIIRNTDRPFNWLLYMGDESQNENPESSKKNYNVIKIAAIDNGLAFPFKHPDSWRSYPFRWDCPYHENTKFSQEIKDLVLEKIGSNTEIDRLEVELELLFKCDDSFNPELFDKQMSVMRGQIHNLRHALLNSYTPVDLINMTPIYDVFEPDARPPRRVQITHKDLPFFKRF